MSVLALLWLSVTIQYQEQPVSLKLNMLELRKPLT